MCMCTRCFLLDSTSSSWEMYARLIVITSMQKFLTFDFAIKDSKRKVKKMST